MRALWLLVLVASCIDEIDPRWQLDHDHVIAARATPPRIRAGEATNLDALVAHADKPVSIEDPTTAELAASPAGFERYLVEENGAWRLEAPDAQTLASARPLMALPEDAPIPVDVLLTFPHSNNRAAVDPFRVKKTVWLGEPSTNPVLPPITVDGLPVPDTFDAEIVLPIGRDVYLSAGTDALRVSWLTNVGTLFQDDVATSFVRVAAEDRLEGQLVVVVRDREGGVAWRVWPTRAAAP